MKRRAGDIVLQGPTTAKLVESLHRPADLVLDRDSHQVLLEAQALIAAAREESAGIREAARQEGLSEGLRQLKQVLEDGFQQRRAMIGDVEAEIVTLAVAVAKKVMGSLVPSQPGWLSELVKRQLTASLGARQIEVWVGPGHSDQAMAQCRRDLAAQFADDVFWTIDTDPDLELGDCVIETEFGRVDARLSVQLDTLMKALLEDPE